MSEHDASSPRIEALGNGRFSVEAGGSRRLAYAVVAGRETWVWFDGNAYALPSDAPDEHVAKAGTDEMALSAPMPATVRAISVSVGQRVSAGDVLVVLEAMKMEMAIKAPHDGTVRAVHCAQGEIVQPGIPLVELE